MLIIIKFDFSNILIDIIDNDFPIKIIYINIQSDIHIIYIGESLSNIYKINDRLAR